MTRALRTRLTYLTIAILPPLVDALYQYAQARLLDGNPVDWDQVAVVAILATLGAIKAALTPRVGAEHIAEEVDALKSAGVPRREMTVVRKRGAVRG